jgi:ankyrin repeat protein
MDTYLKLTSLKDNKNCNCITPFYINNITGINPNTNREYSNEDLDAMKTALYRVSNAKGCEVSTCCDPNNPNSNADSKFARDFARSFPKIMPMYEGSQLKSIKLSTTANVTTSGWQDPTPYFICKITKATIVDTSELTVKLATNLTNDCFQDACNSVEMITVNNLLQNAKADMTYTYFDDARVTQAILEGNITYVKEYIRKYKNINNPLTNDDYNNRMIHLAAGSSSNDILTMLIALKANLNVQNKNRETPIHFAVRSKNIDNISNLVSQGVDLTIPNKDGETAMFYAMKTGDMRIVNLLYVNNSPIMGIDSTGNNLIHYCILNCPVFKEDDSTIPNTKSEIIQFLIDRGISTEQKNNAGITPLELTSKEINRQINRKCDEKTKNENADVIEKFFNVRSIPSINSSVNGAIKHDLSEYTDEHVSLLDIQTKLFNNILRNNPDKYGGYISVDDIPVGAPIEVLDTVCVGGVGITGNEDSEECVLKGGRISKIKNKTTKIKLELIPEQETVIDNVNEKELYYPKEFKKVPIGTVPNNISSYNASINASGNILSSTPQTTGITYNIGSNSTNQMVSKETSITGFNPKPTPLITMNMISSITEHKETEQPVTVQVPMVTKISEHPSMIEEDDTIVRKCRKDAVNNATRIMATTTKPLLDITSTMPLLDSEKTIKGFLEIYKIPLGILAFVVILILVYLIYNFIASRNS